MLNLQNKDYIIDTIKNVSLSKNIEYVSYLEKIYCILIDVEKDDKELVFLIENLNIELEPIKVSEQIFHVVSFVINEIYTEESISNIKKEDKDVIYDFLNTNYLNIFKDYYNKHNCIDDKDYNDCVLSIYNNYNICLEVCDILLGKYIEEFVL